MVLAESAGHPGPPRSGTTTLRDALVIGAVQCIALVPGISRSGATISAGLLRGLDRVAATRLSFFLADPGAGRRRPLRAQGRGEGVGAGGCRSSSAPSCPSSSPTPRSPGCCASSPATRSRLFVPYRVALGALLIVLLATGAMSGHLTERQSRNRIGSTMTPSSRTSKCRCGPVA